MNTQKVKDIENKYDYNKFTISSFNIIYLLINNRKLHNNNI